MLAARVAASLKADPGIEAQLRPGGIGELSVSVDGVKAVRTNPFLYPRPRRVADAVREALSTTPARETTRHGTRGAGN